MGKSQREDELKPVTRYTRTGKNQGREIACPFCFRWVTVYHFTWSAITCQSCGLMIKKDKWLVVDDKERMRKFTNKKGDHDG